MSDLMIFVMTLPIGLSIGFSVKYWMKKGLTPTEKAAKMIKVAEKIDRAAWNRFIKEFNASKGY